MSDAGKIARIDRDCVACGVCVKNCPLAALLVHKGLHAAVDAEKCVGCGKCARVCPAGAIEIELRRCATV